MFQRTALLGLGTVLLLTTSTTPLAAATGVDTPASPNEWHEPHITYLEPPTAKAQEIVAWAIERFHEAGLQLPDLEISFPTLCSGKGALYHVGHRRVDFCRINKRRALHEFAHAWDDTSGAVDRDAFLALRGLHVWWGGVELRSAEQGAEQLAEIVAWGLSDSDHRDAPQFPNNSERELREAFQAITGKAAT